MRRAAEDKTGQVTAAGDPSHDVGIVFDRVIDNIARGIAEQVLTRAPSAQAPPAETALASPVVIAIPGNARSRAASTARRTSLSVTHEDASQAILRRVMLVTRDEWMTERDLRHRDLVPAPDARFLISGPWLMRHSPGPHRRTRPSMLGEGLDQGVRAVIRDH